MRQAGEPSVEEILASIKKVIARDNRAESARREPATAADTGAHHRLGDVLDLGEVAAQVLGDESPAQGDVGEATLTKPTTASAMRDSLAALAMLSAPGAQPQIVRSGETSLEGLVRDMLRPMLAEWLDQNLPAMVDRLVAAEIARIARKKA